MIQLNININPVAHRRGTFGLSLVFEWIPFSGLSIAGSFNASLTLCIFHVLGSRYQAPYLDFTQLGLDVVTWKITEAKNTEYYLLKPNEMWVLLFWVVIEQYTVVKVERVWPLYGLQPFSHYAMFLLSDTRLTYWSYLTLLSYPC